MKRKQYAAVGNDDESGHLMDEEHGAEPEVLGADAHELGEPENEEKGRGAVGVVDELRSNPGLLGSRLGLAIEPHEVHDLLADDGFDQRELELLVEGAQAGSTRALKQKVKCWLQLRRKLAQRQADEPHLDGPIGDHESIPLARRAASPVPTGATVASGKTVALSLFLLFTLAVMVTLLNSPEPHTPEGTDVRSDGETFTCHNNAVCSAQEEIATSQGGTDCPRACVQEATCAGFVADSSGGRTSCVFLRVPCNPDTPHDSKHTCFRDEALRAMPVAAAATTTTTTTAST